MRHLILHHSGIRRLTALVSAAALSVSVILNAGAITQADIDETQDQIEEMQALQEEYESQQADIQAELDDLAEQEDSAVAELLLYQEQAELLEGQIDNTQAIIDDYEIQIADTQDLIDDYTEQIADTEEELEAAEEAEEEYYELFCDRVRSMEEDGYTSYWSILFDATSFSDLLDRIMFITEVMDYDNQVMDNLEAARELVAETKERLEEEKAAQEEAKDLLEAEKAAQEEALADLEDQQAEVEAAYEQIEALIEEIQENEDLYAEQLAELEELSSDLEEDILENQELYEEQIAELEAQIAAEEAAAQAAAEAAAAEAAAAEAAAAAEEEETSSSSTSSTSSSTSTTTSSSSSSTLGAQIASYACQFIGNPYVWGGTSLTNGCDCSGFVMAVYAHFGYSLPHSSLSMRSLGTAVSYSEAQPGDLICYYSSSSPSGGHVGIYIGNGLMVNAASSKTGIVISTVNTSRSGFTVRRII